MCPKDYEMFDYASLFILSIIPQVLISKNPTFCKYKLAPRSVTKVAFWLQWVVPPRGVTGYFRKKKTESTRGNNETLDYILTLIFTQYLTK